MSSGQSPRNGNSVEPGLPNTFLMPNARSRPKVASLTLIDVLVGLARLVDMRVSPRYSPRVIFTSPRGRGRRVAPGEGLRSIDRPCPLTPALSHRSRIYPTSTNLDAQLG